MNSAAIASIVTDIGSIFASIGGVLVLIAAPWITYRTRSAHVIRQRIWKVMHGKSDICDPELKAFNDKRTVLMWFRFVSGVPSRTLRQAKCLMKWLDDNDEEVDSVRSLGVYFDYDSLRVKDEMLSGTKLRATFILLAMLLCFMAMVAMFAIHTSSIFLKVNKSGTWFAVEAAELSASKLFAWKSAVDLDVDSCRLNKQPVKDNGEYIIDDRKVMCSILADVKAPEYFKKTLLGQRLAFAGLGLFLISIAVCPVRAVSRFDAARMMSSRLKVKQAQFTELELLLASEEPKNIR